MGSQTREDHVLHAAPRAPQPWTDLQVDSGLHRAPAGGPAVLLRGCDLLVLHPPAEAVLGFELRASHLQDRCSTARAKLPALFALAILQMQDKYSKSGIACFLEKDDISWDPSDEEALNNPCWQVRRQVRQLIRKMTLRIFEESTPTAQEKRQSSSFPARETRPQRIAAHITGTISGSNLSMVSLQGGRNGFRIEAPPRSETCHLRRLGPVLPFRGEWGRLREWNILGSENAILGVIKERIFIPEQFALEKWRARHPSNRALLHLLPNILPISRIRKKFQKNFKRREQKEKQTNGPIYLQMHKLS
ncbi:tumor necrosis factor ligand superfamily member 10 isoform X2 [Castor canadensis]|uniref:Tumor necrosis factor ligand superfamily member 10 isoform X2 n=1 Tax=Castor canadensis TaxID=51338 RepID=A0AC58MKD4_CASCN